MSSTRAMVAIQAKVISDWGSPISAKSSSVHNCLVTVLYWRKNIKRGGKTVQYNKQTQLQKAPHSLCNALNRTVFQYHTPFIKGFII